VELPSPQGSPLQLSWRSRRVRPVRIDQRQLQVGLRRPPQGGQLQEVVVRAHVVHVQGGGGGGPGRQGHRKLFVRTAQVAGWVDLRDAPSRKLVQHLFVQRRSVQVVAGPRRVFVQDQIGALRLQPAHQVGQPGQGAHGAHQNFGVGDRPQTLVEARLTGHHDPAGARAVKGAAAVGLGHVDAPGEDPIFLPDPADLGGAQGPHLFLPVEQAVVIQIFGHQEQLPEGRRLIPKNRPKIPGPVLVGVHVEPVEGWVINYRCEIPRSADPKRRPRRRRRRGVRRRRPLRPDRDRPRRRWARSARSR
jgi:hypothetical protein